MVRFGSPLALQTLSTCLAYSRPSVAAESHEQRNYIAKENKTFFLFEKTQTVTENNSGAYVRGGRDFGVFFFLFPPTVCFPRSPGHCENSGGLRAAIPRGCGLSYVGQQVLRKETVGNKADAPVLHWHVAQAQEGWKGTQTPASQWLPQPTAGSLIYPVHDRPNRKGQAGRRGSCHSLRTGPSPPLDCHLLGQRLLTAHRTAAAAPLLHGTHPFHLSVPEEFHLSVERHTRRAHKAGGQNAQATWRRRMGRRVAKPKA